MGRVEGKVAFITGAARGQGRSHAVRLAQEGADIIAIDIAESLPGMDRYYEGATEEDLAETVRQVEALDRRIVARKADVRDYAGLLARKPFRPLAEVKARINAIARSGIPEVNAMTEGFLDRE